MAQQDAPVRGTSQPIETPSSVLPALGLTFVTLLAYSLLAAPVPGINEPHYFCKARHYWDPSYCAGDFFLESSNTHLVFYQIAGFLTRFLTLDQTAWAVRIVALALLAFGWTRLISRCVAGRFSSVWTLWVFLACASVGNLSGEWIVGGVEAKVVSYALVLAGVSFAAERAALRGAVCLGAAVSFHPVVGVWSVAAALFAGAAPLLSRIRAGERPRDRGRSICWRRWILVVAGFSVASLPGLIPAVALLRESDSLLRLQGDYIQVFYRLKHHLDPMTFTWRQYASYAGLLLFWLWARRLTSNTPSERFFSRFVAASLLIAVVGWLIAVGERPVTTDMIENNEHWMRWRMPLMKFYAFRLFDVVLPIAASVTFVGLVLRKQCRDHGSSASVWVRIGFSLIGGYALLGASQAPHASKMPADRRGDWLAVCRWIDENLEEEASFVTPRDSWAFKWYAQRAEFVSFKDCPQDAGGIVEWNSRLALLRKWGQNDYDEGYSVEALRRLRKLTGATHLVTWRLGPMAIVPIHRQGKYSVYVLPERARGGTGARFRRPGAGH